MSLKLHMGPVLAGFKPLWVFVVFFLFSQCSSIETFCLLCLFPAGLPIFAEELSLGVLCSQELQSLPAFPLISILLLRYPDYTLHNHSLALTSLRETLLTILMWGAHLEKGPQRKGHCWNFKAGVNSSLVKDPIVPLLPERYGDVLNPQISGLADCL